MPGHDAQMLKGVLSLLLLLLVADQEDYGYSLLIRLQNLGFPELSEGTVYPALTRLESNGYLSSRLVRSASGPARKYYALSSSGQVELERTLDAWHSLVRSVDRFMPTLSAKRSTP